MNFFQSILQLLKAIFSGKKGKDSTPTPSPPSRPVKEETKPATAEETPPPKPVEEPIPTEMDEPAPVPEVEPLPPIPTRQLTVTEHKSGNTVKSIDISDGVLDHKFKTTKLYWGGFYTSGQQTISDFVDQHEKMLHDLDISNSAINVMLGTAENEGNLDAINAYDYAYLSFGIFQWTLGTKEGEGELAALVRKIKDNSPQTFDEYFGSFGLDVSNDTNKTYGFFTLDGKKLRSKDQKKMLKDPKWLFRFWRAGQNPNVQAIEMEHALSRLKTFYWRYKIKGNTLAQIITSEYGVSLILDNHVNMPGYVKPSIKIAMENTGLIDSDPKNWDSDAERKLIKEYLKVRKTFKMRNWAPMTDAEKRGNVTTKYRDKGVLSDIRGTFQYSGDGTRSVEGDPFAPPAGYKEEEYPEIEYEGPREILGVE